jgi:uncharacterized protein YukJ
MNQAFLVVPEEMETLGVADEGARRDLNNTIETLNQEGVDMVYHTYGESGERPQGVCAVFTWIEVCTVEALK